MGEAKRRRHTIAPDEMTIFEIIIVRPENVDWLQEQHEKGNALAWLLMQTTAQMFRSLDAASFPVPCPGCDRLIYPKGPIGGCVAFVPSDVPPERVRRLYARALCKQCATETHDQLEPQLEKAAAQHFGPLRKVSVAHMSRQEGRA